MKDRIWEFEYEGRHLRVTNRFSFFPLRSEELLEVDGQVVATGKGGLLSEFAIIEARVDFAGVERQVEIRIAPKRQAPWRLWTMGCHILIDGVLVGGDTSATLVLPELAELVKARTSYREQPRQFIWRLLVRSIVFEGLPFALLMLALNTPDSLSEALVYLVFNAIPFGSLTAWMSWRSLRSTLQSRV